MTECLTYISQFKKMGCGDGMMKEVTKEWPSNVNLVGFLWTKYISFSFMAYL